MVAQALPLASGEHVTFPGSAAVGLGPVRTKPRVCAADEATTVVLRQVGRAIRDDDRLASAMLPTGDGLLVAVKK